METIDLRSDTVTLPSPAMREAIFRAELGDDVFNEDPTVNLFEAEAARRVGARAALLVPTGTMANLVSLLSHCPRGSEVILGNRSHIFLNEAGGLAAVGGLHPWPLQNQPDGTMKPDEIEAAIRGENIHHPLTMLICLESTHNRCSGAPLTTAYLREVRDLADEHALRVHLDGARIFNAAVALGEEVSEFMEYVDSMSFCLSKGLAAPAGSVVCGSRAFIEKARRNRKMLGGGMRQAGILAAAGLVALEQQVDRLEEDHDNARLLAEGIDRIQGLNLEQVERRTNIVYFDVTDADGFEEKVLEKGIRIMRSGPSRFRMVTHSGIERSHIEKTLAVFEDAVR
jgi:threonine aldolase